LDNSFLDKRKLVTMRQGWLPWLARGEPELLLHGGKTQYLFLNSGAAIPHADFLETILNSQQSPGYAGKKMRFALKQPRAIETTAPATNG
jgi:hypothetical protein